MNDQTIRILLIDDDEDEYILTRDVLTDINDWNFDLEWEPHYNTALETIAERRHDVCLIDYRLGAHNGLDVHRRTRSVSGLARQCGGTRCGKGSMEVVWR